MTLARVSTISFVSPKETLPDTYVPGPAPIPAGYFFEVNYELL